MNRQTTALVTGIVAVAIVVALIVVVSRPATPRPSTDSSAKSSTPTVQESDKGRAGNKSERLIPEPAPGSEKESKPRATAVVAEEIPLDQEDLIDEDTVNRLLKQFGSYAELYKRVNSIQREQLIDFLQMNEKLRDEIGNLLPLEDDSELRSYILRRVTPQGYFDNTDGGEPVIDHALIAILDKPTNTPIGAEEWLARMDLANNITPEYALRWVRDARSAHGDDPVVQMHSSAMTITIGSSVDGVDQPELEKAVDTIKKGLTSEGADTTYSRDDRARAYFALYFAPDHQATIDFLKSQQGREPDQKLQGVMNTLIQRLDKRLATQQQQPQATP